MYNTCTDNYVQYMNTQKAHILHAITRSLSAWKVTSITNCAYIDNHKHIRITINNSLHKCTHNIRLDLEAMLHAVGNS